MKQRIIAEIKKYKSEGISFKQADAARKNTEKMISKFRMDCKPSDAIAVLARTGFASVKSGHIITAKYLYTAYEKNYQKVELSHIASVSGRSDYTVEITMDNGEKVIVNELFPEYLAAVLTDVVSVVKSGKISNKKSSAKSAAKKEKSDVKAKEKNTPDEKTKRKDDTSGVETDRPGMTQVEKDVRFWNEIGGGKNKAERLFVQAMDCMDENSPEYSLWDALHKIMEIKGMITAYNQPKIAPDEYDMYVVAMTRFNEVAKENIPIVPHPYGLEPLDEVKRLTPQYKYEKQEPPKKNVNTAEKTEAAEKKTEFSEPAVKTEPARKKAEAEEKIQTEKTSPQPMQMEKTEPETVKKETAEKPLEQVEEKREEKPVKPATARKKKTVTAQSDCGFRYVDKIYPSLMDAAEYDGKGEVRFVAGSSDIIVARFMSMADKLYNSADRYYEILRNLRYRRYAMIPCGAGSGKYLAALSSDFNGYDSYGEPIDIMFEMLPKYFIQIVDGDDWMSSGRMLDFEDCIHCLDSVIVNGKAEDIEFVIDGINMCVEEGGTVLPDKPVEKIIHACLFDDVDKGIQSPSAVIATLMDCNMPLVTNNVSSLKSIEAQRSKPVPFMTLEQLADSIEDDDFNLYTRRKPVPKDKEYYRVFNVYSNSFDSLIKFGSMVDCIFNNENRYDEIYAEVKGKGLAVIPVNAYRKSYIILRNHKLVDLEYCEKEFVLRPHIYILNEDKINAPDTYTHHRTACHGYVIDASETDYDYDRTRDIYYNYLDSFYASEYDRYNDEPFLVSESPLGKIEKDEKLYKEFVTSIRKLFGELV